MSRRYTNEERHNALKSLDANDGDILATSEQTGIPPSTLRDWAARHREERAQRLLETIRRLHEQLAENAVNLAAAIDGAIDGAPLNQLSTALGTVIDRYLKVDEHLAQITQQNGEQVFRFEYVYPDGSVHNAPPWANDDYDIEGTLPRGGVRTPLWENGGGETHHRANGGGTGGEMLVARPDVYDGEPGVARFEDDLSDFSRVIDE